MPPVVLLEQIIRFIGSSSLSRTWRLFFHSSYLALISGELSIMTMHQEHLHRDGFGAVRLFGARNNWSVAVWQQNREATGGGLQLRRRLRRK